MALEKTHWQDYVKLNGAREHSVVGALKVLPGFWSPQLENERDILVYLPPSYRRGSRRYPVIYMQDGQNLFDRTTSFAGEWQVDETMEALSQEGLEAIVVGIPNLGERRMAEYSPFPHRGRPGQGDHYLAFIVETLKPQVDRDFRTRPGLAHTGIFGSSMGGLISLYGYFHYPYVFGFVGAMSPAFWFAGGAIYDYVTQVPFAPGRIYLDNGTRENSARRMYTLLTKKGYRPGRDIQYVREEGAGHEEAAWAGRLPEALRFLLQS